MPLELHIAWRYLRSRRGSRLLSFISVIAIGGVVVGVSALIVVMGIMNGLQRDLREKILIGTPDIRVLGTGPGVRMDDWHAVLATIKTQPRVVAASPFVMTQALANAGHDYMDAGVVVGVPGDGISADITSIGRHVVSGSFRFTTAEGADDGIVMGSLLASRLGARVGDRITLYGRGTGLVSPVTGYPTPLTLTFQVTGVFQTGMYDYDNSHLYVSLTRGQELAGLDSAVSGIEVKTESRWITESVADQLEKALNSRYAAVEWQEQNRSLFQALKLEKLGMGLILLLIVLVAAFNIVSNLTMVVADKTREIGILKAMGMTSRSVRRVFFAQGLVIGVAGTIVGVVLGVVASIVIGRSGVIKLDPEIYFIDHLPVATDVADVLITIVASIAIAALATFYPSRQAARLYPIEAIRHE
jgi:lipoprotein-releasing system permease protein